MACYDGLISIKGLCTETTNTLFWLDDIGISLVMAAHTASGSYTTGKNLIERKIEQGWRETFNDIQFKGMNANKILNEDTVGVNSEDTLAAFTGFKGMSFELYEGCSLARFYISKITLSVVTGGATSIKLTQGTTVTTIYTGTPTDNTEVEVILNQYVDDFSVTVDGTSIAVLSGSISSECCNGSKYYTATSTGTAGQNYGLQVEMQVRCDKDRHTCKFVDKIASAARYKIGGLIWKEVRDSNAFNDLLNIKKADAITMAAWMDSSFNLLKYDPAAETTYQPKGMYQQEMKNLNIPVPKCKCCLECAGDSYRISLP